MFSLLLHASVVRMEKIVIYYLLSLKAWDIQQSYHLSNKDQ